MEQIHTAQEASNETLQPDDVGKQQKRTRNRVFRTIGTAVDIIVDSSEFAAETAGYVLGRGINGVRNVSRAVIQGNKGEMYRHAA